MMDPEHKHSRHGKRAPKVNLEGQVAKNYHSSSKNNNREKLNNVNNDDGAASSKNSRNKLL